MKAFVVFAGVILASATVGADIVAWVDEDGVRHFTNVQEEIPPQYRDSARVIVNETARRSRDRDVTPESHSERPASAEPLPEAVRALDETDVARAYVDGLRCGMQSGRGSTATGGGGGGGGGGSVQIYGPLAVANANARDDSDYDPFPAYAYGYPPPQWYPFVTTSFDRGRSRHLTLRMLLQDQFTLDRAAPYVYVERLPPFGYLPLGPNLNPFLARGLPAYSVPATTRVIVR